MPIKKSKKQSQVVKQKQKQVVKQVVNVKVGDMKPKRKAVARPRLPEPQPALFRQPPINVSLSTQSYQPPATQSYINEYNALLKQVADERRAALQNVPLLTPNTNPLTTNEQRNELLSRSEPRTQFSAIVEAASKKLEDVVNLETYDDPLTNENQFVNSSRLGEKLAQRLPVTNFDFNDVNNYDMENAKEQKALEDEVEEFEIEVPAKPRKKGGLIIEEEEQVAKSSPVKEKKPTKKEKQIEETNALINFYNLEVKDNKPLVKSTMGLKKIKEKKQEITDLINERALKVSKMKV